MLTSSSLQVLAIWCALFSFANNCYAQVASADVGVSYNVPVACSIMNLPSSVNLSILATETGKYNSNFYLDCNSSNSVSLMLTSLNQNAGQARLLAANGNYLNYNVIINNVNYDMNQIGSLVPNVNNTLQINVAKPTFAGKYQDSLVFLIQY